MGACVGKSRTKVYAIHGKGLLSTTQPSEYNTDSLKGTYIPEKGRTTEIAKALEADTVLCEAQRPDWVQSDFLLFDCKAETGCNGSLVKSGNFFSKRTKAIGQWHIRGNVLKIFWGKSRRGDSLLAVNSEREFINFEHQLTVKVVQPVTNPIWFMPDQIGKKYQKDDLSSQQFECQICFFSLCQFPAGYMRRHSRRSCPHYLHMSCGQYLMSLVKGSRQPAKCPMCSASFSEMKPMPDIQSDPRQWFAACDADFGGALDESEIIEGLGATLPVERTKLQKLVSAHWDRWDPDGDGTISMHEFIGAESGLLAYILKNMRHLRRIQDAQCVPALDRNPRQWFEYWDSDGSGTLEKDEVVRALIRSFCLNALGEPQMEQAHHLREVAVSLWEALGYNPFESVDFAEFARPYGLMDQCLHNHAQTAYIGDDDELVLLT